MMERTGKQNCTSSPFKFISLNISIITAAKFGFTAVRFLSRIPNVVVILVNLSPIKPVLLTSSLGIGILILACRA